MEKLFTKEEILEILNRRYALNQNANKDYTKPDVSGKINEDRLLITIFSNM